jgi:hypothetical protein
MFQNAPDVPRLPQEMDIAAAQKTHGALVNRQLPKCQKRGAHLVRAYAVDMHMDISQGNFSEIMGPRERTLI